MVLEKMNVNCKIVSVIKRILSFSVQKVRYFIIILLLNILKIINLESITSSRYLISFAYPLLHANCLITY